MHIVPSWGLTTVIDNSNTRHEFSKYILKQGKQEWEKNKYEVSIRPPRVKVQESVLTVKLRGTL